MIPAEEFSDSRDNESGMKQGDTFTHVFRVSEEIYNSFIQLFNDRNPLHTDPSFAVSKGFRDKVMHGNILNGFLSYFIGECLPAKHIILHSQRIKFSKPVYMDDRLTLCAEIKGIHDSVNVIELAFFFQNQHHDKVASGDVQIGLI